VSATAEQEFLRQLQSHLLEVNRAYWSLFMERSSLAQKVKLYLDTATIYNQLVARQKIDAQQSQLASAQAALYSQRSDLVRAEAAVKNAETRLRALINAQQLGEGDTTEIIPTQLPSTQYTSADITTELEIGIQNRPEIIAAVKEIKAGSIRLNMAKHEMLPLLNMITQVYASGLQGDSDVGQSWVDQFSTGPPSYSVGVNYEIPLGNRASRARAQRRQIELRQLEEQYRAALENVRAEIEVAVRELNTSYRELSAKNRARSAAIAEAETLRARWKQMIDGNGTAGLTLIALLEAQKRVTDAEFEFSTSQLVYNLAMSNLQRANGTLLQAEEVDLQRGCLDDVPKTFLSQGGIVVASANVDDSESTNVIAATTEPAAPMVRQSKPLYDPNYQANSVVPKNSTVSQPENGLPKAPVISPNASVITPTSTRKERQPRLGTPVSSTDKPEVNTVQQADHLVESEPNEPKYSGPLDYYRKN
jgi:outer membrane protein